MSFRHHPARTTLLAAALLAIAPTTVEAQLGKLRRKMEQQIEKSVLGQPDPSTAAPVFNERVLEITDARVTQLIAGLRVESAQEEREERAQAALDAKAADHDAKVEAYGKCSRPFTDELLKNSAKMAAFAFAGAREEKAKGAVSPALRDSIDALGARMKKTGQALEAKCGKQPEDPSFDDMGGEDSQEAGAKAAKLTGEQYAVLRERVTAYLQSTEGDGSRYLFTANERAALSARGKELAGFRKLLTH